MSASNTPAPGPPLFGQGRVTSLRQEVLVRQALTTTTYSEDCDRQGELSGAFRIWRWPAGDNLERFFEFLYGTSVAYAKNKAPWRLLIDEETKQARRAVSSTDRSDPVEHVIVGGPTTDEIFDDMMKYGKFAAYFAHDTKKLQYLTKDNQMKWFGTAKGGLNSALVADERRVSEGK